MLGGLSFFVLFKKISSDRSSSISRMKSGSTGSCFRWVKWATNLLMEQCSEGRWKDTVSRGTTVLVSAKRSDLRDEMGDLALKT